MLTGIAIASVLSLFASIWCFFMARDPKQWRIHWLNAFGIIDLNSTRDQRRKQESQLKFVCIILLVVLLAVGVSCAWFVIAEATAPVPERTEFEKDQDETRKQMDKIRAKKSFGKLR
jgi:hypothetical protein